MSKNFNYSNLNSQRFEHPFTMTKNSSSVSMHASVRRTVGISIADDISPRIGINETNIGDNSNIVGQPVESKNDVNNGSKLITAIRQQAKKISELRGIQIEIVAEDNLVNINNRILAEVFQIVTEELCNIRRQTKANYVLINIECSEQRLKLEIQNNNPKPVALNEFLSKSINNRAASLNGKAYFSNTNQHLTISVEIPIC